MLARAPQPYRFKWWTSRTLAHPTEKESETMKQEMLINVSQPEECRIAIVEDSVLEELYIERTSQDNYVGNIYKGRVVNLEPSIQAAFVDFGVGRNGFLHISDIEPQYFRQGGFDPDRPVESSNSGRGGQNPRSPRAGGTSAEQATAVDEGEEPAPRRERGRRPGSRPRVKPPIQDILRRGDEVLVQVIKEGIGTKGPTLSTYISIPGRYLVLMPALGHVGVSASMAPASRADWRASTLASNAVALMSQRPQRLSGNVMALAPVSYSMAGSSFAIAKTVGATPSGNTWSRPVSAPRLT